MADEQLDYTRRNLLIAGSVAVAATAISPAARARPASLPTRFRVPAALMNKAGPDVDKLIGQSKYAAAKKTLFQSGKYPFLAPFSNDLCVDKIVYDVTSSSKDNIPPYDPFQVESLVSSASILLDRCLGTRRDMYDMEDHAVQRALEYDLFDQQFGAQRDIELAPHIELQRSDELLGQTTAQTKFSKADDPLASGFSAIAASTAKSTTDAIAGEKNRKQLVGTKWDALRTYQSTLEDRHNTPGAALNYVERFGRLEQLLRQDVQVAFYKLRCIEAGMNQIFGLGIKLPPPAQFGYLDAMVTFVREVIERANIATQEEVDFEHIISLRQPGATTAAGPAGQPLISDAVWNAQLQANGLLSFTLPDDLGAPILRARLRAVGLSVAFDAAAQDMIGNNYHPRSVAALIFLPNVPDLFSLGSVKLRPPVVIGSMSWLDPANPKLIVAPQALNLNPAKTTWQIQLSPNIINQSVSGMPRASLIKDVRLHLRCSAVIDTTNPWPQFNW